MTRRPKAGARRILLLPLSNVLGHLTRTLALAEAFDAAGHTVHVADCGAYPQILRSLPSSIRVEETLEFPPHASRSFGPIRSFREGTAADRANLEQATALDADEVRRRAKRLARMVERDRILIDTLQPDAIVTDYRFTPSMMELPPELRLFHISHVVGFPSLHRRVFGQDVFPLDAGHILVPGVRPIEYWRRRPAAATDARRESLCGPFFWRGWQRLDREASGEICSDVLLCFGSTGHGEGVVPRLRDHLEGPYRVADLTTTSDGLELNRMGDLGRFLSKTEVAICHGGHGTVMQCILHRVPMIIIPHNVEQLEIGRRMAKMGLSRLVTSPAAKLDGNELRHLVESVGGDRRMRSRLAVYSRRLEQEDGADRAASIVLDALEARPS